MSIIDVKTGVETFVDAVLSIEYREVKLMSDVYGNAEIAIVWTGEKIDSIQTMATDGHNEWRYSRATVDATLEAQEAAEDWKLEQERQKEDYRQERAFLALGKGKIVRVVRGRKVPIGTIGFVHWTGSNSYGRTTTQSLGIALNNQKGSKQKSDGTTMRNVFLNTLFVDAANCEVLGSGGQHWKQLVAQWAFQNGKDIMEAIDAVASMPEICDRLKNMGIEFRTNISEAASRIDPLMKEVL